MPETNRKAANKKKKNPATGKRLTIGLAGLLGGLGVGLSAMAAHLADARLLGTAAAMCLAHAPALLALSSLQGRLRLTTLALVVLMAGLVLFVADLVYRHLFGHTIFPMAAPTGGVLMIFGWLILPIGAVFRMK